MNDQKLLSDDDFIATLNRGARGQKLVLPVLRENDEPPGDFVAEWAKFLETVVKQGVLLSDPRWKRVAVIANSPHVRFRLDHSEGGQADPDFRLGLKLLMGLLEDGAEPID